jgi:AhpD family alkylhydroperoxidase
MDWADKNDTMRQALKSLNAAIPEASRAFGGLGKAVKADGALDFKAKEFVALGISVSVRCEPCIGFHVEALIRAGATRQEIAEVLAMCVQMGGGPSLMYAAKALDCYDDLAGPSG